jgi:hypothetical protein
MQILLRKIRETENQFDIKVDGVSCSGCFWRSGKHKAEIEGKIQGDISLTCDRCGEQFFDQIEEPFHVMVVDQPLKVTDCLDVIECLDGIVNFDMICKSEISSIQSEYHLCEKCKDIDEFEIEY